MKSLRYGKGKKPRKPETVRRVSFAGPKAQCIYCLDTIQSKHRNDLVFCKCKKIAIDGGAAYTRCIGTPSDFIWLDKD